jgi:hypothetical protein
MFLIISTFINVSVYLIANVCGLHAIKLVFFIYFLPLYAITEFVQHRVEVMLHGDNKLGTE